MGSMYESENFLSCFQCRNQYSFSFFPCIASSRSMQMGRILVGWCSGGKGFGWWCFHLIAYGLQNTGKNPHEICLKMELGEHGWPWKIWNSPPPRKFKRGGLGGRLTRFLFPQSRAKKKSLCDGQNFDGGDHNITEISNQNWLLKFNGSDQGHGGKLRQDKSQTSGYWIQQKWHMEPRISSDSRKHSSHPEHPISNQKKKKQPSLEKTPPRKYAVEIFFFFYQPGAKSTEFHFPKKGLPDLSPGGGGVLLQCDRFSKRAHVGGGAGAKKTV